MNPEQNNLDSLLNNLSAGELRDLLVSKAVQEKRRLPVLKSRKKRLEQRIEELDREIAAIENLVQILEGGPSTASGTDRKTTVAGSVRRKRARPKRRFTLREAIRKVLERSERPLGPAEIRDAIVEAGLYENPTQSFYQQIVIRLTKSNEFESAGNGKYRLR